ncbi:MAG: AAA family ATPase [Candidatus Caldarchaeum sp.]
MVIAKGGGGDYVLGSHGCTCMAGTFGKKCKHIAEAERRGLMPLEINNLRPEKSMSSFSKELNIVAGGDFYNSDVIVAVHGKAGVGKSLFSIHECVKAAAEGRNFLYIDTEGGFKSMAEKWLPKLQERFGELKGHGYVETRKTLASLHEFLGYKTEILWVKEKMEFRILSSKNPSELEDFVEKKKIDFIVVDSVSAPVEAAINEERQNRPARFSATALIMGKLAEVQEKYGSCILTIHHSSFDPTNPYEVFARIRGGKIVQHYCKRILYMDMREKSELSAYRRLWVARMEDKEKFSDVVVLRIGDDGFFDVSPNESLKAGVFTSSELEYLEGNPRFQVRK